MELESYFDFLPDGDIRIKGTRVYLEDVIKMYLEGESPEEITTAHFLTLSLEQAYATILYYLANRLKMDAYIAQKKAEAETRYQEYTTHPSEFHLSLKKRVAALRQERKKLVQVSQNEPQPIEAQI